MSKLFSWAIARSIYGLEISPCADVKPGALLGAAEARQRVLNDTEIRALWKATEGLGYPTTHFVRLLLLTGQQLREVAEAQWSEFNLEQGIWTIPAGRMKGNIRHEVPLPSAALEILKSLPRWTGPFVFSSTAGARPISGFSKLKSRIDAALGDVEHWTFHDIRRSVRTGLSALPIPSNICELVIAHHQSGLHKTYDLYSYRDEKRRAFELWAARLAEIVEPGSPDNVVVRLKTA